MSNKAEENSKELNGIYGFFRNRNYSKNLDNVDKKGIHNIIKGYCKEKHNFEGSLDDCADLIQDNFNDFVSYTTHNF